MPLTPKQQKVLAALLREPTQKAAAASTGVSDRQIREYLSKPEFQEAYRQALSELVEQASIQARRGYAPALDALREIVVDPGQPPAARISAARSLLEYGLKLTEQADILAKLDELEKWRDEFSGT